MTPDRHGRVVLFMPTPVWPISTVNPKPNTAPSTFTTTLLKSSILATTYTLMLLLFPLLLEYA